MSKILFVSPIRCRDTGKSNSIFIKLKPVEATQNQNPNQTKPKTISFFAPSRFLN